MQGSKALGAMTAVATAFKDRSLDTYQAVLDKYTDVLQGDPLVQRHLKDLYVVVVVVAFVFVWLRVWLRGKGGWGGSGGSGVCVCVWCISGGLRRGWGVCLVTALSNHCWSCLFPLPPISFSPSLTPPVPSRPLFFIRYDTMLEQNICRIIEPYSHVEIQHVADKIKLPLSKVMRETSRRRRDRWRDR